MDISLRPATDGDLPFLLELRLRTMDHHFIAAGMHRSRDEHMQRVLYRFEYASVIIVDGNASGLLKIDRNGTDWHLMQIQVLPEIQSRGVGTQLLGEIVAEARRADATIRLGVLKVNPARRLYERLGFTVTEETADSVKMRLSTK